MCRDGQYFTGGDYPEYDCDEAEQAGCSNGATVVCEHSLPGECALDYRTPHSKHEQVEGRALSRNFSKFPVSVLDHCESCETCAPRVHGRRTVRSGEWRLGALGIGRSSFAGNDVLRCVVATMYCDALSPVPGVYGGYRPRRPRGFRRKRNARSATHTNAPSNVSGVADRGVLVTILTRFKSSLKIRNRTVREHRRRTTTRFRVLDS